ncbi:helix-turn-helix domain-containing protein [Enterobacter cloacae complex sp. P29RS]|uniref:GlxA family transcriptional regulator n=1 Tax=Enterobacter cloacae complex sp. P29RS TaxID=2779563 RepID=UPI0018671EB0|nr:helix-turn-helix domain-containing protein [Enterobacter cloacae complex sp. P29RS]MBE3175361.1 helix-turn-helix domain-containing protein [Enterobacter cloacae complex sp. P29RS]
MSQTLTKEIAILVYPHAQQAAVLGLMDLLAFAEKVRLRHDVKVPGPVNVTRWHGGRSAEVPQRLGGDAPGYEDGPDVIILPPSLEEPLPASSARPCTAWLCDQHASGATIASVCAGAFLLGETGLLRGRTITTHWQYAELFNQRFPDVRLDVDQLLIDDDDIITAGGAMAWVDLGLRLVDRYYGAAIMIETAQRLLVDPPGRQQRFYSAFSPRLSHGDRAVLKVQHWLEETGAKETALPVMAALAGLEERTFLRRFQKATGMTTTEYCQRLRVGRAREMLQSSQLPLERIAWDVGYSDTGAFRKVFTRIVGLTPGDYRRRFQP